MELEGAFFGDTGTACLEEGVLHIELEDGLFVEDEEASVQGGAVGEGQLDSVFSLGDRGLLIDTLVDVEGIGEFDVAESERGVFEESGFQGLE